MAKDKKDDSFGGYKPREENMQKFENLINALKLRIIESAFIIALLLEAIGFILYLYAKLFK